MTTPETGLQQALVDLGGTIDTAAWPQDSCRAQVVVQLEDGTSLLVPREALIRQEDGSYHLILDPATLEQRDASAEVRDSPLVVPVLQEVLDVRTRQLETGRVRIRKSVQEHEELVDPPLWRDDVVIERVSINRVVEGPISVHSEEDTLIIPVLEEVFVIEKRLLLKEEVRITKHRIETHMPQRVLLRREEAAVERINREGDESNP